MLLFSAPSFVFGYELSNHGYSCLRDTRALNGRLIEVQVVLSESEEAKTSATVIRRKVKRDASSGKSVESREVLADSLPCLISERDQRVLNCFEENQRFPAAPLKAVHHPQATTPPKNQKSTLEPPPT